MALQEFYTLSNDAYTDYLKAMLQELMETKFLSDVTLVSDDKKQIQAHKVILCAASPLFKSMIENLPVNSMIYLRGIKHLELKHILDTVAHLSM